MRLDYINPFIEAVKCVFRDVFEENVSQGRITLEQGMMPRSGFIVSFGLAGEVEGEVAFDMGEETVACIAKRMNHGGQECPDIDAVTDSVAELMNMIIGKSVTILNDRGFKFYLTPPAIFTGKDIKMRFSGLETLVVPLKTIDGDLRINVALRPVS